MLVFGRTGTNSLKIALNALNYKCYHMKEVIGNGDASLWLDEIVNKEKVSRQWNDNIFKPRGYTATVDWPTTHYFDEIFNENPSAKVCNYFATFINLLI